MEGMRIDKEGLLIWMFGQEDGDEEEEEIVEGEGKGEQQQRLGLWIELIGIFVSD